MPTPSGATAGSLHAKTDLYDEQNGTFLIQYPILLVVVLALTGVAAFAITGFLGWPQDTSGIASIFQQSWLLFLWLCALIITLYASIFRDKSLRGHLIASLVITALAVVLIGITYFSQSLPAIIRQLLDQHRLLATLARSKYTYSVVNFGLLAIFWGDTVRRWARRARGESPSPAVDIGIDSGKPASKEELPSLQELVSGDLIAAAVLTLLLAGLFWGNFLPQFVHPVITNGTQVQRISIDQCTLSWPIGTCTAGGGTPADPPTLTFVDIFQTLVYLPLGLLILALSAMLSGFGAVGGVDEPLLHETDLTQEAAGVASDRGGALPVAQDVATTVLDTLKAALSRRLMLLGGSLLLSLRTVAWPCLTFIAVYAAANLSSNVEWYLHSERGLNSTGLHNLALYVGPAVAWGVLAVLAAVASPALMLFRWRVAENTLQFLRLIGLIVLLTFWIFSLALLGVDQLLTLTGLLTDGRHPFSPPSFATAVSAAALAIFGVILLVRRSRGNQAVLASASSRAPQAPEEAGAPTQRY